MKKRDNKFTFTLFVLTILFFYIPLVVLIVYSFNSGKGNTWTGFSTKWYTELFQNSDRLWVSFRYSIKLLLRRKQ